MRITQTVWLLLSATLVATGCDFSDHSDNAGVTTYRHALDGVPGSLDPAHAGSVYTDAVVVNLYDTLYRYRYLARPYQLAPNLARDFPQISDDGLTWTITLRDDARFVDDPTFDGGRGRPVVASDVVFSLKRHFMPETRSQGAWLWRDYIEGLDDWIADGADADEPLSGLEALDEHTVRIRLTEPYPQLTHTLALALSAIVPREAVTLYGREFGVRPVGSGPFRLVLLDETRAILARNPDFNRGVLDLDAEGYRPDDHDDLGLAALDGRPYPFVDRLELHFITEPTARWTSFVTGGVDYAMVPAEQASRVLEQHDPPTFRPEILQRYHARAEREAGFVLYGFNMDNPAIGHHPDPGHDQRNRALRCAIRDAFDWQARNTTFYHGLGQVFPGVIPPFLTEFDPDLSHDSVGHNPQRAQQRLAEHGWNSGNLPRLTYGLESSVHQRQMFEQFRALMAEAGIPGDRFRQQSYASFADYRRAMIHNELDLFLIGWTMAYPDALYSLQLFYGPNASPGANSFNYRNTEFDRLFERAAVLESGDERTALFARMNRLIIDDCVMIGSLSRTRLHLWQRRLHMLPDRDVVGGYFLRFVAVEDKS